MIWNYHILTGYDVAFKMNDISINEKPPVAKKFLNNSESIVISVTLGHTNP